MKQLLTEHIPFTVDKLLVEQSIKENKPLRVSGIIQRAGVKNHNGRIYEQDILEREITKYIEGPVKEKRALGELDHPESPVIQLIILRFIILLEILFVIIRECVSVNLPFSSHL